MTNSHVTRWSVALTTCFVAATASAQGTEAVPAPDGSGPGYVFRETMSTGLVPLFAAMGAGIAFMLVLALIFAGVMRRDIPRFEA